MRFRENIPMYAVMTVLALGIGILVWRIVAPQMMEEAQRVSVMVPPLSSLAGNGKIAFDANCAGCHGVNAGGTDKGPPLLHDYYNPGHHPDAAFYLAAQRGVRQHHWNFGDMPAQPQVTTERMQAIVQYVRELQQANGITFKPHNM